MSKSWDGAPAASWDCYAAKGTALVSSPVIIQCFPRIVSMNQDGLLGPNTTDERKRSGEEEVEVLARSAQCLRSGERPGGTSLKRVAWCTHEALGPRLARALRCHPIPHLIGLGVLLVLLVSIKSMEVLNFDVYHLVQAVRTGPRGYRYTVHPLPGSTNVLTDIETYQPVPPRISTVTEAYRSVCPDVPLSSNLEEGTPIEFQEA
ncbi:hypothetical protein C4D60_Mb09t14310 [Musa balbisiana]|uniref:Uncharacterized protein n=1 Tax=Musa balbisiana TaxID=52838 RepID=A0A4V4H390_MUSBA|nr:hypothetical protein C4D60_Mb09t14310 [Musa balbisiana]